MRISDWSSDVCSSDLFDATHRAALARPRAIAVSAPRQGASRNGLPGPALPPQLQAGRLPTVHGGEHPPACLQSAQAARDGVRNRRSVRRDRKSAVEGKSVSVSVDIGGRGVIKKKKEKKNT